MIVWQSADEYYKSEVTPVETSFVTRADISSGVSFFAGYNPVFNKSDTAVY